MTPPAKAGGFSGNGTSNLDRWRLKAPSEPLSESQQFSAAFRSRPSTRPQAGHVCARSARVLGTCSPQPEQRCVVPAGFTLINRPTSFFRFVGQDREELAPASVVDGLRQHRTGQSLDVQVFDGDQPVVLHEVASRLVVEVAALIGDVEVYPRHFLTCFQSTSRTFLPPRQLALGESSRRSASRK